MLIRRLINEDNDRLFSRSSEIENLIDKTFPACLEVMKLIEFKEKSNGRDTRHWFDILTSIVDDIGSGNNLRWPQLAFSCTLDDDDLYNFIKNDYRKVRNKFGNPEEVIDDLRRELMTTDNRKYSGWVSNIDDFLDISNEQYLKYYKYISLCLSGDIGPDEWDPWTLTWDKSMMNMEISTDECQVDIRETLEACIKNITENISY